jgi:hypothetical protein
MKPITIFFLAFSIGFLLCITAPQFLHSQADRKPSVQLNAAKVQPHELEDTSQKAILRDYTAAWQALAIALDNNSTEPLNDNFTGFALEELKQKIKEQQQAGLRTRIVDHGHRADAIFYAPDGSAVELRDTASLEIQVLDGNTVLYSGTAQVQYLAVLTGAADRWQVRVLDSVPQY